jgi:acetolactate synthase-1/2/3 large subunit
VFGYPGGAVLPIYDALFGDERIRTSWCVTKLARPMPPKAMPARPASPASCWSLPAPARPTPSPALPMRFMDSIPMVVITGQVPTGLIGTDAFQEADTVGITRHCTKHNYLVKDPSDSPRRSTRRSRSPPPAAPARS